MSAMPTKPFGPMAILCSILALSACSEQESISVNMLDSLSSDISLKDAAEDNTSEGYDGRNEEDRDAHSEDIFNPPDTLSDIPSSNPDSTETKPTDGDDAGAEDITPDSVTEAEVEESDAQDLCGNGVVDVDAGEVCDDGNIETETSCAYGIQKCVGCSEDCTSLNALEGSFCGDGLLNYENGESCDDGANQNGDGCSDKCALEPQCSAGCLSSEDCAKDEKCEGKPSSVSGATGQCAPKTDPPGVSTACSANKPCPEDLACLGEFMWAGSSDGFCVAAWQAKDFFSFDNLDIPDDGTGIQSSVVACGLATVPEDIVVTLHLDHPSPEDLIVKLQDPNGQEGTVLENQAYDGEAIVTSVGSGDDTVNGLWTLSVTDTVTGQSGKLLGWSVYLLSRYD